MNAKLQIVVHLNTTSEEVARRAMREMLDALPLDVRAERAYVEEQPPDLREA